MLILPGLAFAKAMNSGTLFAGNTGFATMTKGVRMILEIGAMSRMIETELRVQRRVVSIRQCCLQQSVAVSRRAHDRFSGDVGAGARLVLDYERLTKPLRKPLAHQSCHDVGRPACAYANDDAHWPRRVSLRPRDPRHGRQRDGAHGQL